MMDPKDREKKEHRTEESAFFLKIAYIVIIDALTL